MPASIRLIAVFVLCLAAATAAADDKPLAKKETPPSPDRVLTPFLWKIDGETPNYLLGTMHTVDKRVTDMHPVARKAFEESEAVFLEVDLIRASAVQLAALRLPDGKKTSDFVPADLLERLDNRLAKISKGSFGRVQLGELKPFAWVILVPTLHEQFKKPGTPVLDAKLYGEGMRGGKKVGGLEDPKEQTAFVDSVTHEEGVLMLRLLLDEWDKADKEGKDPSSEMVDLYLRGDGDRLLTYALAQLAGDKVPKDLGERLLKAIGEERNERQAKAIVEILKANPKRKHFFAVGAMHLLGPKSVQEYLAAHGIKTSRVPVAKPTTESAPAGKPEEKKQPAGAGAGN